MSIEGLSKALTVAALGLGFALATFVTTPAIAAGERIVLRTNVAPGMSFSFRSDDQMDMDMKQKMAGQEQQMRQQALQHMAGRIEILDSANGKPTAARITFDRECGGSMSDGTGNRQPIPSPLAAQTITVRVDPTSGRITNDARVQLSPTDQAQLEAMLENFDPMLPKTEVGVGESWQPDPIAVAKRLQADPTNSKVAAQMTLKEIRDVDGRRVAVVAVDGEVVGNMQGLNGQTKLRGVVLVDVETGRSIGTDLGGEASASGITQQQAPNGDTYVIDVNMRSTFKNKSEAKVLAGGAGANRPAIGGPGPGPVAPGPFPPPSGPPSVSPGAPPSAPPLASAPPEGTFSFADEKIKFTFTCDPRVPGIRGEIVMGEKRFPVKVNTWDGRNVAGAFESQGNEFPFNAKLEGDAMTFTTGGKTYNLKNTAPKARNPLED